MCKLDAEWAGHGEVISKNGVVAKGNESSHGVALTKARDALLAARPSDRRERLDRRVGFLHRTLLSRSAIRVCQPGPVAFQSSITSAGNRREINLRGFGESGLPPLFTFARASISSVSSGRSSYSSFFKVWASTRAMSDFKEWRDAFLFAFIGFPHTKNVAIRATRCIAYDDHPPF